MRSPMTGFRSVSSLLAVASVLTLAPAFAQERGAVQIKVGGKRVAVSVEPQAAAPAAMPDYLAKIELSAEQQQQVKAIVGNFDASLTKVWGQFSERYIQMIAAESSMLAAIEDNLTEPQLAQVRSHRHRTAQQGQMVVDITKPKASVEKELSEEGITLTDEQAAASDKVQELHHANLHVLHGDIQRLHARLLALKADKLAQIENILTKEQLMQLRANRKNAPVALKIAPRNVEPTKAETNAETKAETKTETKAETKTE